MLDPAQLRALRTAAGADHISTEPATLWAYGMDNSRRHAPPDAVVYATGHDQVREVVRTCYAHRIPLIARGRGTGTTGATVPIHGGVVLSFERMNHILEVNPDDRLMVVEPGVTNSEVQAAAREHGFFWAPDPTSSPFCSVGGNLAYNSAGPRAVKYGTVRENVLSLRAITGQGEELRTGTRTTKGVVGYDLTRLLIGSEGTLAIITEATLKLTPLPEAIRTARALYADIGSAARAVARLMAQPVTPCALEFIDGAAMDMIRGHTDTDLPRQARAMLMIEVDGPAACLESAITTIRQAAEVDGLLDWREAREAHEVESLWSTRKALSPALRKVAPKKINEDVVVPVSRIPELIEGLERLSAAHRIPIINFGHAGNGNIHVNLLLDPDGPGELARAHACLDEVFTLVLALGGTLSGEHGVGLEKRDFIERELGTQAIKLMQGIKQVFDPAGILNADKTLPLPKHGSAA
ncbi:MAG: FAD-linked oxidase C-terminal domain-containing protein [Gammaproteobacteria bacterium]|nr:FAD-linked oxidase C-terminal domain-containing protein [Gammaproteobacteria bacterium]